MILGPLLIFITGVPCYPPQAFCPPVPLLLSLSALVPLHLPPPIPKYCFLLLFFFPNEYTNCITTEQNINAKVFSSAFIWSHQSSMYKVTCPFLYICITESSFCKAVFFMSVYICQFSNIVYIPDLLLLRIRYHWVLSQNITEETSYLL